MHCPRRGLYLITRETPESGELLRVVASAVDGGAVMVQYRDKSGDPARRRAQARTLCAFCHASGVPFVVNDDLALAREVGADGVHVGEQDATTADARATLGPDAIIGASAYDQLDLAIAAQAAGASYVAFGSFFDSPTKPNPRRPPPSLLTRAAALGLPRVAIGGITVDNARRLVEAGADLVAVISAIFDAPDPRAAARRFATLFR
jgi:thiamine-phosphate pyrophosphorylase